MLLWPKTLPRIFVADNAYRAPSAVSSFEVTAPVSPAVPWDPSLWTRSVFG